MQYYQNVEIKAHVYVETIKKKPNIFGGQELCLLLI